MGTKAFNLQLLMALGFDVPPCFVVTTGAHGEQAQGGVSGPLLEGLRGLTAAMEGPLVARSSSVTEDTAGSSKAGVFTTVLDVQGADQLAHAVERVWASAAGAPMGVIVQQQLRPQIAGVLFTRDPLTGGPGVIEYVKGLGESLVSGKRDPVRTTMADTAFATLADAGGAMERFFGFPVDVEWAKVGGQTWILQVRPITALPVPDRDAGPTYSMVQAEDFFSGPVTPLFATLFRFLYEEYYIGETMAELGVDTSPWRPLIVRHRGYLYASTALAEYGLQRVSDPSDAQQMLRVLPDDLRRTYEQGAPRSRWGVASALLRLAYLQLTRPRARVSRADLEFERRTVPAMLMGLQRSDEKDGRADGSAVAGEGRPRRTRAQCRTRYEELMALQVEHIRASRYGLAYCMILTSAVQRVLLRRGVDDPEATRLALMSGLPHNKTMEGIEELRRLAAKYRGCAEVRTVLREAAHDFAAISAGLRRSRDGALLLEGFKSVLARYGHRRLGRDLIEPSWRDDPMIPFALLREVLLSPGADGAAPPLSEGRRRREQTLAAVLSALPRVRRPMFRVLAGYLLRYVAFRELQRFYLDMIISRQRDLFLDLGDLMVRKGALADREDIFFLELPEVEAYLQGQRPDVSTAAGLRRLVYDPGAPKPGLYLRCGVSFDSVEPPPQRRRGGDAIVGMGISRGSYRGKVTVIERIDSRTKVPKGAVLVTRSIDPGQTMCFSMAGALVLEVGGALSHGAILARELSIPAVGQVRMATRLLREGQDVTVDGTGGVVILEQEPPEGATPSEHDGDE